MTRRATIEHAVVLGGAARRAGGGRAAAWILRELSRFGVTRATLLGFDAAAEEVSSAAALLPKRVDLSFRETFPRLEHPALLVTGDVLPDANLARLLADFAADEPALPARVLLQPSGAFGGMAAVGPGAGDLSALDGAPGTVAGGRYIDLAAPATGAPAPRPALFLDRDGVLNHDHAYVGTAERWEWVDGAREAVRFASDRGWHVFVVTNQSGVARGYYTEAQAQALLAWAVDECRRVGGTIDDVRYCPDLPDAPLAAYRRDTDWRKPGPGMLNDIVAAWGLDPARCIMVGDRASDAAAGEAAGMAARIFPGGNLCDFVRPLIEGGGLPNRAFART